ncbi:MAG: glycosyltransferase, partial [Clostridia bacterium]|nr:glycosyltransferase [Clostridia bacterium]
RREYGFGDKLVIGHVGRLAPQKNQKKILEVFSKVHKMNPNTHLVIIGTGELEKQLKDYTNELGLKDFVTFTGVLSNVNEWYSAFDVFVMTSLYEGLPVVAIEAQASDLPCVLCDTITDEVKITERVKFAGLKDSPDLWAEKILGFERKPRTGREKELGEAGYDIKSEAVRMQNLYLDLYNDWKEKQV